MEDRVTPSVSASFQVTSDWGTGFVASININNDQPIAIPNWRLEFDFSYQINQIWNARIDSHVGNHYAIDNAGYNSTIFPNSTTEFGFLGQPGNVTTPPANYILNGTPLGGQPTPTVSIGNASANEGDTTNVIASIPVDLSAVSGGPISVKYATHDGSAIAGSDYVIASGTLTFAPGETHTDIPITVLGDILDEENETFSVTLSDAVGAIMGTTTGVGTIVDNDSPPGLSVSDVTGQEPIQPLVDPGFFYTNGNQIVDAAGRMIRIAGVNWFGMETPDFAPHGLWARNYRDMMDQMVSLGFNTIRLPFCNQLFDASSQPNGIDYGLNPDLQGLNGFGILDKVVDYAGQIGLRIILDCHRSDAGGGPNGSGLWYTPQYPESRWIADWTMLATRYEGNPTVIGADLINEPHGPANWGNGDVNDWRLAAERAGNAILAVNPNWLIFVEGVEATSTGNTWWGGNLSNAGTFPVRLDIANRLVYSPHDYPASVFPQPWFGDPSYPNNLNGIWDKFWGYLYRQGTAPVMVGEFGTRMQTPSDQLWLQTITNYLTGDLNGDGGSELLPGQQGPSWLWWSWNPNSGDTGGILKDDWISVNQEKIDALAPIEFPWSGGGSASQSAVFTVTLSAPSGRPIQVNYTTVDGSATAGLDYKAASGTLSFAPGETSKTVSIAILGDDLTEPSENFFLRLSNPNNATLSDDEGEATIRDSSETPPPTISIGNAQVTEGDVGTISLTFTVTLSTPSTQTVTVDYQTQNGSAVAGDDYVFATGTLAFLPGVTSQPITILIVGDKVPEATEVFRVLLSNPGNATIANDKETGTIVDNDTGFPGIRVVYKDRDDWGTGFVADMTIFNDRSDPINGWTLEFDFDRNLTNIWNAVIVSYVGNHYVIRNAAWNAVIPPNGRVDFGFQGAPGNALAGPSNYVFNGVPLP